MFLNDLRTNDSHKHAISFDRSVIGGSIFLRDGFNATGQVRLIGTTIKNDLDCSGGKFYLSPHARDCNAVFVIRSMIKGDVSFRKTQIGRYKNEDFVTNGSIYLNCVEIGGNLDLTEGVIFEKNYLDMEDKDQANNGLLTHNCVISRWIKFRNITPNNETVISLSGTTSGGLDHNWNEFLSKDCIKRLAIDRFIYDKYECRDNNRHVTDSMEWLKLLDNSDNSSSDNDKEKAKVKEKVVSLIHFLVCYRPLVAVLTKIGKGEEAKKILNIMKEKAEEKEKAKEKLVSLNQSLGCYQQLAIVLTKIGRRQEAEDILINMEEKRFSCRYGKFISWILKYGIGFGYRPLNALIPAFIIIFLGGLIFQQGYKQKAFYPIKVEASKRLDCINSGIYPYGYPSFHPFIFSAEEFLPVINLDLGVKKNWWINDKVEVSIGPVKLPSWGLEAYSWLHRSLGWIISTLIVGGFTAYFIRKLNQVVECVHMLLCTCSA